MAELIIRASQLDVALLERLCGQPDTSRPHRIVVDAHMPLADDRVRVAAQTAGLPFAIDPQTYYLQDFQHPTQPWTELPYAHAPVLTPADLLRPMTVQHVAREVIDYQVDHGATHLIAPYVSITRPDDGWLEVQTALWRATREHLDRRDLHLPTLAVVAVGWRLLDPTTWPLVLRPLGRSLRDLSPTEVALAGSNVDAGAHPEDRAAAFASAIRWISKSYPVIAWQQGTLGELAVLAGARGYETGIGWRERCDLNNAMAGLRDPRDGGGNARPVYCQTLRRSIPKRTLIHISANPRLTAELTCPDPRCCPNGRQDLLTDARAHAIAARQRSLRALTAPDQESWRWHQLAQDARSGARLVDRLNTFTARTPGIAKVSPAALRAIAEVAAWQQRKLSGASAA